MAGLPWYGVWTDFPVHGKTLALCAALRDDNAGMYVIRLFSHCATQALDGLVPAAVVEGAAGWKKRRGVLLDALTAVGFLESRPDGLCLVHGWEERNGARIKKALADAKKPRGNKGKNTRGPDAVPPRSPAGPTRDAGGTDAGSSGGDRDGEGEETEKKQAAAAREARPLAIVGASERVVSEARRRILAALPPRTTPLVPLKAHDAVATFAADVALIGIDRAVAAMVERAKTWPGGPGAVHSMALLALPVGDLARDKREGRPLPVDDRTARAARFESALVKAQSTCEVWAGILQHAARKGLDPAVIDRVLVDVQPERRNDLLELTPRDAYHAAELVDRWLKWLTDGARFVSGEALRVEVMEPAQATGSDA